jgi:hypothetical protein
MVTKIDVRYILDIVADVQIDLSILVLKIWLCIRGNTNELFGL